MSFPAFPRLEDFRADVITLEEVAALFRTTPRAIRRLVTLKRFSEMPPPMFVRPLRWSKADLERHLRGAQPVIKFPKQRGA